MPRMTENLEQYRAKARTGVEEFRTTVEGRIETLSSRAVEVGLYLPLGVYSKARDELSGLSRTRLEKLFSGLIDRGQSRLQPVEKRLRRRGGSARRPSKSTSKTTAKPASTARKPAAKTTAKSTAKSTAKTKKTATGSRRTS